MNNLSAIIVITLLASFVIIGGVALLSSKGPSSPSNVPQNTDLVNALQQAKNTNKLVFLDFYSDSCIYCKQMEQNTYPDAQVQQKISQNYIFLKVYTDQNPDLSSKYKVYSLPTILILNGDGEEVKRIVGYQSPEQLLSQI